jgi:hypothetical protein
MVVYEIYLQFDGICDITKYSALTGCSHCNGRGLVVRLVASRKNNKNATGTFTCFSFDQ